MKQQKQGTFPARREGCVKDRTSGLRALCILSLLKVSSRSSEMGVSCSQPSCDQVGGFPKLTWFKFSRQCLSIIKKQERASIYKTIVDWEALLSILLSCA